MIGFRQEEYVNGKGVRHLTMRDTILLLLVVVLFLSFVATACSGPATEDLAPPRVEGPALIMFYTDNRVP